MTQSSNQSEIFTVMKSDSAAARPRIDSRQLFLMHKEVVIEHSGDEYRLRITSNGKLILTK